MGKLSVIIPVYNAEKWISETLDSIVNQTYKDIEIIVVDDGSSDNSLAIVNGYAERDDRIKIISKKNGGVSSARNVGIENATGDYVAFIDADDYVELDAYEKLIKRHEECGADITFCSFVRFFPNGKTLYMRENSLKRLCENPGDIQYFFLYTEPEVRDGVLYTDDIHGAIWRSIFRRDIIVDNDIRFPTDMRFAEDMVFILKYLQYCKKAEWVEEYLLWYRANTKPAGYHNLKENNMSLLRYQKAILEANNYYSRKRKKQLAAYLSCQTYFWIINEEYVFKPEAPLVMKQYTKEKEFRRLLTVYSFWQKFKVKPELKRIILFILLKLRMWRVIKRFYKNKKY